MKKKQTLASEFFSSGGKRHYFVDMMLARNNRRYIRMTRSEQQDDGKFKYWCMVVFEQDFENFITAFSSLFQAAAYQGAGFQTLMDIAEDNKAAKGIKAMPEQARPREKLLTGGAAVLTDEELLAILLGSGTPGETAVKLAGRILKGAGGRIDGLGSLDISSLCRYKGMGIAKACSVLAAVELSRRINQSVQPEIKTVYLYRRPEEGPGDQRFSFGN